MELFKLTIEILFAVAGVILFIAISELVINWCVDKVIGK